MTPVSSATSRLTAAGADSPISIRPPGQLPVSIVDTAHKQDLIAMISHERKRGREKFAGLRRCDVVVVLRPRHAPDHQQPETPQQQTHD
jgi:hypothetical protein